MIQMLLAVIGVVMLCTTPTFAIAAGFHLLFTKSWRGIRVVAVWGLIAVVLVVLAHLL